MAVNQDLVVCPDLDVELFPMRPVSASSDTRVPSEAAQRFQAERSAFPGQDFVRSRSQEPSCLLKLIELSVEPNRIRRSLVHHSEGHEVVAVR